VRLAALVAPCSHRYRGASRGPCYTGPSRPGFSTSNDLNERRGGGCRSLGRQRLRVLGKLGCPTVSGPAPAIIYAPLIAGLR
jgi:hypothetical protein